jgi:hypothetical protein
VLRELLAGPTIEGVVKTPFCFCDILHSMVAIVNDNVSYISKLLEE